MAMKDFDFKGFLLQRGEQVGLGVAVLLAFVLLLMGSKGFFAGSASGTAQMIDKKKQEASDRMRDSKPPENIATVSTSVLQELDVRRIDPQAYELASTFVTPTPLDDTKRRNPEVLLPVDFDVKFLRAPYRGFYVSRDWKQIYIAQGEGVQGNTGGVNPANRFGPGGMAAGPGAGGLRPPAGFGPRGGDEGGIGESGVGTQVVASQTNPKRSVKPIDIKDLPKNPNVKLAEQIYPYHVAVVSAAFPYKEQLENFRRSLSRKATMNDLFAAIASGQVPFKFEGFDIQRRVTLPSGRIKDYTEEDQGWKSFNDEFQRSIAELYPLAARFEPEDPKLVQFGIIIRDGLVMGRPAMGRDLKYPPGEADIPSIKKTVEDLERAQKEKVRPIADPRTKRFEKKPGFNPFNPFNPLGEAGGDPNQMGAGGLGGEGVVGAAPPKNTLVGEGTLGDPTKPAQEEPLIPEYVLVRFLDLTVLPGHSYEYRIRIKMANPNYGKKDAVAFSKLAKEKELVAPKWAGTGGQPERVPESLFYYVVDEKPTPGWTLMGDQPGKDPAGKGLAFQIHRWLPQLRRDDNEMAPVANWILLERAVVHRGEYVGREESVEVPFWDVAQEADILAATARDRRQQRIPVPFRVPPLSNATLVDFEGGRIPPQKVGSRQLAGDEAPLQALILDSNGKLIARNSAVDTADEERKKVHEQWRAWIRLARGGGSTGKMFNDPKLPTGGGNPGGGN